MFKQSFMKKAGVAIFSAALAFSMLVPTMNVSAATAAYLDGTYEGSGQGYLSTITVSVTIEDGKIVSIDTVSESDTEEYFEEAKALYQTIIDQQSADVDVVSGATYSSNGIKDAVKAALKLAEGEDLTKPDASIFAGGDGTEANPFQIQTADQLSAFAGSLTENMNYEGYYVALTSDIDMSASEWSPIGGDNYTFNGTFDGQGHAVSNVHIGTADEAKTVSVTNVGFFGKLGGKAVVKNVSLKDEVFNVASDGKNVLYEGGIAGASSMSGVSYGGAVVDSCHVDGIINGTDKNNNIWAGGITGMPIGGAITNCDTNIDMDAEMKADVKDYGGWTEVGGIAGLNFWTFVGNCYSTGDIAANFYNSANEKHTGTSNFTAVGGINGLDCGTTFNCYTRCNVVSIHNTSYIGAISGFSEEGYANIYASYYDTDATLVNGGKVVKTIPAVGVIEDNVTVEASAFDSSTYSKLADMMTDNNANVPANITSYGIDGASLLDFAYYKETVKQAGRSIDPVVAAAQKITVSKTCSKTVSLKYSALKKKAKSIKIGAKANTALSYKVSKGSSKYIKVSSAGTITMKKKCKKGTYKVTVTAKATPTYKQATKTITIKVK